MRNLTIMLISISGLIWAAGCAHHVPDSTKCLSRTTPALLFDRYGGTPVASRMAYRSGWPSTPSLYQLGETVYYRERFLDIQVAGPSGRGRLGHTYRRFDTIREGSAVR